LSEQLRPEGIEGVDFKGPFAVGRYAPYPRHGEVPADGPLHRHCFIVPTAAELSRFTEEEQCLIAATCLAAVAKPFELTELLAVVSRAAASPRTTVAR